MRFLSKKHTNQLTRWRWCDFLRSKTRQQRLNRPEISTLPRLCRTLCSSAQNAAEKSCQSIIFMVFFILCYLASVSDPTNCVFRSVHRFGAPVTMQLPQFVQWSQMRPFDICKNAHDSFCEKNQPDKNAATWFRVKLHVDLPRVPSVDHFQTIVVKVVDWEETFAQRLVENGPWRHNVYWRLFFARRAWSEFDQTTWTKFFLLIFVSSFEMVNAPLTWIRNFRYMMTHNQLYEWDWVRWNKKNKALCFLYVARRRGTSEMMCLRRSGNYNGTY